MGEVLCALGSCAGRDGTVSNVRPWKSSGCMSCDHMQHGSKRVLHCEHDEALLSKTIGML